MIEGIISPCSGWGPPPGGSPKPLLQPQHQHPLRPMAGAEKGPSGPGLPAPPARLWAPPHTPQVTRLPASSGSPATWSDSWPRQSEGQHSPHRALLSNFPSPQVTSPIRPNAPREADPPLVLHPSGRLRAAASKYAAVNGNKRWALGTCGMLTFCYSILKFI